MVSDALRFAQMIANDIEIIRTKTANRGWKGTTWLISMIQTLRLQIQEDPSEIRNMMEGVKSSVMVVTLLALMAAASFPWLTHALDYEHPGSKHLQACRFNKGYRHSGIEGIFCARVTGQGKQASAMCQYPF